MRDFQRSAIYNWEDEVVHSKTKDCVPFDQLQALVNYVWEDMGLKYPPEVVPLHASNKVCIAKANRLKVFCPKQGLQTTILLHELAHSMTALSDGADCAHRPRWVGVYIRLLAKYAGFSLYELEQSLKENKIKFSHEGVVI